MPLILIASATLGLIRLDNTHFWDDETLVTIVTKNLLSTGRLTGWDGRNLLAYRNGTALDKNLRPINAPLDMYVAAASFKLFGINTWAGRFPFVLMGVASVWLLGVLLGDEFGRDSPIRFYGMAFFGLSTVLLLNMRQCRYYTIEVLCCLVMFWAYRRCLATKKWRYFTAFAAAGAGAFYASYLLGPAFWLAMGAYHLGFYRKGLAGRDYWKLACAVVALMVATIPYAVAFRIWYRPDVPVYAPWYIRRPVVLYWNLRELNLLGYMPWMLAVVGGVGIALKWKTDPAARGAFRWAVLGVGYVFFLSVLTNQPVRNRNIADVRYLIPAAPFLAGCAGVAMWFVHGFRRWTRPLAWALLAAALGSTVLTVGPGHARLRWLLPAYLKEISAPYPTSYALASEFLARNARDEEIVYAWPEYCNYPLMFYQGDRLRFGCLLNRDTHLGLDRVRKLDAPLLIDRNVPDWYIAFGIQRGTNDRLKFFQRPATLDGRLVHYSYQLVETLDVFWAETARPELQLHSFGPETRHDPKSEAVYIYKRGPLAAIEPEGSGLSAN